MAESSASSSASLSFFDKLQQRVKAIDSLLCVGLDPHSKQILGENDNNNDNNTSLSQQEKCDFAFSFCKTLIDATIPYAACYKPNGAFFEALGNDGMATLQRVLKEIPLDIPILLDVKRGDIGSTGVAYAEACFDHLSQVDAVTLSPLMGWDSVEPFVSGKYTSKGAFLLCKTSNPGSNDLLALNLSSGETLFERIAKLSQDWSTKHGAQLGLVVGATDSNALTKARAAAGESVWILAPGVGAQGGDLEAAMIAGLNTQGTGMLVPVSRGISKAADPGAAAKELVEQINVARTAKTSSATTTTTTDSESTDTNATIQNFQKEFLEFSLQQGVLKFGSFVLKSGRTSPYFFNAGLFDSGASLYKLGKSYASAIMASSELTTADKQVTFDVIFGPAYKGISLGAVVCASLYSDYGINVQFAYNRKEAKDHGEGGTLVGASMVEKKVLIIDDVITAGTAIRESYALLNGINAKTIGVLIALDRAEKRSLDDPISAVQAVGRDLNIPVVSIVSLPQLQIFLEKNPNNDYGKDILQSVKEYRSQYGV